MKKLILFLTIILLAGCCRTPEEAPVPSFRSPSALEIAVFGADTSSSQTAMNRSDVIRIVRMIPEEKTVKVLAVQRDTMAMIPGYGFRKINLAHDYGGGQLALETLNLNLDLQISEYVSVSFDALIRLADMLGGIDLELSGREALILCGTELAGTYHLDGKQMLAFCRIRNIDDDWHRIERQNRVIRAILQKMKGCSLSRMYSVIRLLSSSADCHMSAESLRLIAEMIKDGNMELQTETFPFSPSAVARNLTIDGIDQIYELCDLRTEVCQAHLWLYGTESCILSGPFENLADSMYEQYPVD